MPEGPTWIFRDELDKPPEGKVRGRRQMGCRRLAGDN
jgi:hypothetical protein